MEMFSGGDSLFVLAFSLILWKETFRGCAQCLVLCMFCIRQFMVIFFKTYYNKIIKNGTALRESAIYKTENGGTKV